MKNNKICFAEELKERIKNREMISTIGSWIFSVYSENKDDTFDELLYSLMFMEEGKEFELSYEELEKIADDLIEGELKDPDPSIEKSATILDETWLMCPDCIDAWECTSKNAMVICPKCNQVLHNPRWNDDGDQKLENWC